MSKLVPHLSHLKYRPDIDGLRAVSVLSVMAYHAFPNWIKGGFIGVDVFFVISGFLISTIIFQNLEKGTFSFSEFYARRIRRIFPALILIFFACLLFGWFSLVADEFNQLGKHIAAGAGFISNLILLGESGYFDNSADTKPLLHLWSLGIEEQFYIIWPLLLWLAWKCRFNFLFLTIFIAVASFSLNILQVYQDSISTFYSPLTRFWELLCGTLLAWNSLYNLGSTNGDDNYFKENSISKTGKIVLFKKNANVFNIFSFSGIFLLIFGLFTIHKDLKFPGYWALVPVLGAVLIIMGGPKSWLNRNILSHKFCVWFGLISFPLYLWHWPILSFGRILYFEVPPWEYRIVGLFVSVVLAWLTMVFIERPFRFGLQYSRFKVLVLSGALAAAGITGVIVSNTNFSYSHSFDKLSIKRKGSEHAIGSSLAWFRGKENWLFLGNGFDNSVAKLKLSITPSVKQIETVKNVFSIISNASAQHGIKTVLIVGPNKSSIYPEYLPEGLIPSPTNYSSFFLNKLKEIRNLTVYDPTNDLLAAKNSEGILYLMTDTHWNNKGAFLAFSGFSKLLNIPFPNVKFKQGKTQPGDLLNMSKLENFPLHFHDNWDVVWNEKPEWTEKLIPNEQKTEFGPPAVVTNEKSLSNQYVWVVGDSFARTLKQYFNATFNQVRYVGHLDQKLNTLHKELDKAERKPNLIVIIRVERSF